MSRFLKCWLNPAVALQLLLRGIWIPHLKGVTDESGALIYFNHSTGARPPDYEAVILTSRPYKDKSGTAHNLIEMTNSLRDGSSEFWRDVLNISEKPKTRKDGSVIFDENGQQVLNWPAQPLWDECKTNSERRDKIREILLHLHWSGLPIRVPYSHEGEQLEAPGVVQWGLSFDTNYYMANKALCFSFYEKYQQMVDANGEEWKWVPCIKGGVRNFRQLITIRRERKKPNGSLQNQGFEPPTTPEQLNELIKSNTDVQEKLVKADNTLDDEDWSRP